MQAGDQAPALLRFESTSRPWDAAGWPHPLSMGHGGDGSAGSFFIARHSTALGQVAVDQSELTHRVGQLVLQLGAILIAAKLGAEIAQRLRQPTVLGEL